MADPIEESRYARFALRCSNFAERWFPDSWVIAALAVIMVAVAALGKLNIDQAIDDYGNMVGVPATIIATSEQVAQVREERAKQQQQQQAMQTSMAAVQGAKTLSETQTDQPSALSAVTGAMQP